MMAKTPKVLLTVRIDRATDQAIRGFCSDCGYSRSDGVNLLLASGLGRRRNPETRGWTTELAQEGRNGSGNGHGEPDPPDEDDDDGGAFEPTPIPHPQSPPEPPPIAALDRDTEVMIDDVISRCHGFWPIELDLLRAAASFVLEDPDTTPKRLRAVIKEGEALGHRRNTGTMTSFLLDRMEGKPADAVGPFILLQR